MIVGVESSDLWHPNSVLHSVAEYFDLAPADHAVIVSGIDTSDPQHVRVNVTDPGTGDVAKSYPLEQFLDAWKGSNFTMVSTAVPAPDTAPGMANFPYNQGHLNYVGHAPYDLVHGLANSFDPMEPDTFRAVENQYMAAVHGDSIDFSALANLVPIPGLAQIRGLFDAVESLCNHAIEHHETGAEGHNSEHWVANEAQAELDLPGVHPQFDASYTDVSHDTHHDHSHPEGAHTCDAGAISDPIITEYFSKAPLL